MQASPNVHLDVKHMTESLSIENRVLIYLEQNQRLRNFKVQLGIHTLNAFVSSVFGHWSITTFSFFSLSNEKHLWSKNRGDNDMVGSVMKNAHVRIELISFVPIEAMFNLFSRHLMNSGEMPEVG